MYVQLYYFCKMLELSIHWFDDIFRLSQAACFKRSVFALEFVSACHVLGGKT